MMQPEKENGLPRRDRGSLLAMTQSYVLHDRIGSDNVCIQTVTLR